MGCEADYRRISSSSTPLPLTVRRTDI